MADTAIIDFRSRYVVGYAWAWEGSSASIATALRHAVLQHGPCELIYFDNGKDFCKVAKGAVPGYVQPNDIDGWAEREMRSIESTGVLAAAMRDSRLSRRTFFQAIRIGIGVAGTVFGG